MKPINERLKYIPETGDLVWVSGTRIGKVAGCKNSWGYTVVRLGNGEQLIGAHRLAFLLMGQQSLIEGKEVDHINGDRSDNRWVNLRPAQGSQNQANRSKQINNSSGAKGVCWHKHRAKWQAQIQFQGRMKFLGNYESLDEAKEVYELAARMIFGDFAHSQALSL